MLRQHEVDTLVHYRLENPYFRWTPGVLRPVCLPLTPLLFCNSHTPKSHNSFHLRKPTKKWNDFFSLNEKKTSRQEWKRKKNCIKHTYNTGTLLERERSLSPPRNTKLPRRTEYSHSSPAHSAFCFYKNEWIKVKNNVRCVEIHMRFLSTFSNHISYINFLFFFIIEEKFLIEHLEIYWDHPPKFLYWKKKSFINPSNGLPLSIKIQLFITCVIRACESLRMEKEILELPFGKSGGGFYK